MSMSTWLADPRLISYSGCCVKRFFDQVVWVAAECMRSQRGMRRENRSAMAIAGPTSVLYCDLSSTRFS